MTATMWTRWLVAAALVAAVGTFVAIPRTTETPAGTAGPARESPARDGHGDGIESAPSGTAGSSEDRNSRRPTDDTPTDTGRFSAHVRVRMEDGTAPRAARIACISPVTALRRGIEIHAANRLGGLDHHEIAERFGESATADEHGDARLWLPDSANTRGETQQVTIYAWTEDAYGFTAVPYRQLLEGTVELRIAAEQELRIRVLDSAGRPAPGVRVNARMSSSWSIGHTDAAGRLVARHVQTWLDDTITSADPTTATILPVFLGCPDDAGIEIALRPPPADEVTLWLPPTGSVTVTDPAQAALPAERVVEVEVALRDADPRTRLPVRARPRAGVAEFPYVALAKQYVARRPFGAEVPGESVEFAGPIAPGEHVEVALPAIEHAILTGTLELDGGPAAELDVVLRARRADGAQREEHLFRVRTDSDGALWTIAADRMVDGRPWTITAERIEGRDPSERRRWSGRFAPPTEVRRGPNGLGRAALEEEAPLVTGRIEGLPAAGRTPDLWMTVVDQSGRPDRDLDAQIELGGDGAFVIWGTTTLSTPHLAAWSTSMLPHAPVPFAPGDRDVVVAVDRGGSLAVDVVLHDERLRMCLRAWLRPTDGRSQRTLVVPNPFGGPESTTPLHDRRVPRPGSDQVQADPHVERLHWPSLPAGEYQLELGGHGRPPLLTHSAITIRSGQRTHVGPLDLGSTPKFVTITLVMPPDAVQFVSRSDGLLGHFVLDDGATARGESFAIDGIHGTLARFVAERPTDVTIEIPGLRRVELTDVYADREVELRPGIRVTIGAATGDGFDDSVRVRLEPAEGTRIETGERVYSPAEDGMTDRRPDWPWARVDGARLETHVTAPGRWNVRAERRVDDAWRAVDVTPAFLEVAESGATVEIAIGS